MNIEESVESRVCFDQVEDWVREKIQGWVQEQASAVICGGLTAMLGAVGLLGSGIHDAALLMQGHPSFVPMQYVTSLFLVLGGIGMLHLHRRPDVATLCGVVAASVGVLTLVHYLFATDWGLDQLFIKDYTAVETSQPGHMTLNTAICFALTGSAIVVTSRTRGRAVRTIGLLSFLTFVLGTLASIGYLSGHESSYGWGNLTRMAVHAAAGFAILSTGLLALSVRHGLLLHGTFTTTVIFFAAVAIMLLYVSNLQSALVESNALGTAVARSKALTEFRTLYSSEAVVKEYGLEVIHDYVTGQGEFPVPATLSMLLGAILGEHDAEAQTKLYSAYPFPSRTDGGGLADQFTRDAWAALNENPDQPFYRFEQTQGRSVLRYATADLMLPSCVNCHNAHPDLPEQGWRAGDVRGVQEVLIPLDSAVAQTRSGMRGMLALVAVMSIIGLSGLIVGMRKFRRNAAALENQVAVRTRDLEMTREAADAANIAKSEFLANMSHEIRTPMTAILGFANILVEHGDLENAPPERIEAATTIKRNGEYLLGIINNILDLSKIEAGKMTIECSDCQPCLIVAEVASLMRVRADAKGLTFSINYIGTIPETIQSDSTRLRQILLNLVGNAIKFTEVGGVRLATRFVGDGDEPCVQFDVIDTGDGVTEKAELFQQFMQSDNSSTRKAGGTGLGLTISKGLATQQFFCNLTESDLRRDSPVV